MPNYRRNLVPGGTYFFTVTLRERGSDLLVAEISALRQAVQMVRAAQPFRIDAWVVLPDHLHCLWTLPEGDAAYPARWWAIKRRFSALLPHGVRGVWQRGYWEHTIRNERDFAAHIDYVHFNPVKHGLAVPAAAWPYSTFRRCVAQGLYPADWAVDVETGFETGE